MNFKVTCVFLFTVIWANYFSTVAEEGTRPCLKEEAEIDKRLKILNKPYVKTFKDNNGDNYDCVDMYKQPAFDHPLLKNYSDQIRLSLQARQTSTTSKLSNSGLKECPSGTVLIKRTTKESLIRAQNKKHLRYLSLKNPIEVLDDDMRTYYALEAFDYESTPNRFFGAVVEMEVYRHSFVEAGQTTSSQFYLINGAGGPEDRVNAVQFGWQIAPSIYGNTNPNLFALYTSDGYKQLCLNYECGSFVQVSKKVTLGQPIPDNVARINMFAAKVVSTGDWALYYKLGKEYEEVGFWPKALFNNMDAVKFFEAGGLVSSPLGKRSPPMGNGVQPTFFSHGAVMDHIAFRSISGFYVTPDETKRSQLQNVAIYYNVRNNEYIDNGFKFEYGGPGGGL